MKRIICLILAATVLLSPCELQAGKGYSSGGSRSSGSSRGSFSGSSSRGSSFSGRSSTGAGKSYSLGGGTKPPSHSISSPSSKPSKPSVPSAKAPSHSVPGKTYSSSSKPVVPKASPSSKPIIPKASSPSTIGQSGKSYSSGAASAPTNVPKNNISADGNSRKPTGSNFNKSLSDSAKKQESKQAYTAKTNPSVNPKPTYKPAGSNVEKPINPKSPPVQTVRRYVTHERYVTYDHRLSSFYGPYYGRPAYYSDYFSPFLMGWLLSDALNSHQRALWVYHHQDQMDQARYAELLRNDAQLQAEINQLRAQNIAQDPSYVPPQMADNPDLMYSKEFVDAAYNPVETQTTSPTVAPPVKSQSHAWSGFFFFMFILGGIALVYLLFFREF
jgi:hypothetical protein